MSRVKNPSLSFKDRLRQHADNLLEIAGTMPSGHQREELQRKAGQIEVAIHMDEWLNSRGLRPPT